MDTTAVGSSTSTSGIGGGFAALDSGEFLNVLISELQNQDPFKPQDTTALLQQLSSLRSIESETTLTEQLKSLVSQFGELTQQGKFSNAGGLIGKLVHGFDINNEEVVGLVTTVRLVDDHVMLELDTGRIMPYENITEIAALTADTPASEQ